MDRNPYKSPREIGYYLPRRKIISDWWRDRFTELAIGLLLAIVASPLFVAVEWISGRF